MSVRRRFLHFLWIPLALLLAVPLWRFAAAQMAGKPPAGVELQTDIVFGQGGGRELQLDLTRRRAQPAGQMPALVIVHGGGWAGGDKKEFHPLMFQFSQGGILCVSVNYRLAPRDRFPAQIEDLKCAVRWLRAHAEEYHVDPERIAALGASAGAHLAALLATTPAEPALEGSGGYADQSSAVCAAVCLAGPYDLALGYRSSVRQRREEGEMVRQLLSAFLGGTPEEVPEVYRQASPIHHLSRATPPMLLVHGTDDPLVLIEQAEVFAKALEEAGVPVKFLWLEGGTHDSFGPDPEKALREITTYVRQSLKVP